MHAVLYADVKRSLNGPGDGNVLLQRRHLPVTCASMGGTLSLTAAAPAEG